MAAPQSRPKKQEQEEATTDVVEVAPGVVRTQLPINFTGLGHVNMYLLLDDRGAAVVDPGLPGGTCWKAIEDRLRRAGLRQRDVHTVIVTHSHPDHFGGAGRLAHEAGARLVTHATFRIPWLPETFPDLVVLDDDGFPVDVADDDTTRPIGSAAPAKRWSGQSKWGPKSFKPPLAERIAIRTARALRPQAFRAPVPTLRLRDGEPIRLAGRDWFAVHTPGHTEDHLCLHDPEDGVLLTGDHVLPSITPHISGLGSTDKHDPLDAFIVALDKVAAMAPRLALPAHGHPFTDVGGRVDAIKAHHDRRLEQVHSIAAALGEATVEQYSERLFPKKHWGLMAESETFAHLEHLRHRGRAHSYWRDAELIYVVDDVVSVTDPRETP